MPTKNNFPIDDRTAAGLVACYERLPHAVRRQFWQTTSQVEKLLILAGHGGAERRLTAAVLPLRGGQAA